MHSWLRLTRQVKTVVCLTEGEHPTLRTEIVETHLFVSRFRFLSVRSWISVLRLYSKQFK